MKVWKKCEVLFLTVLLCITMMAVPVLAASDSQDGLEVTLTTDKEKYSKGEEIVATLTVTNTNDTAVSNVSLENLTPEGYKLADGSEGAKQVESLGAGETVSLTVTYVAEESDAGEDKPNTGDDNKGNTEKPDTGDNSGNTGNIGENKGNTTTGGGTDKEKKSDVENGNKNNTTESKDTTKKATDKTSLTPTTGDNTNIAVWVVLLLLAGSGIAALISKKRKNNKKQLLFIVGATMAGALIAGLSTEAYAEKENSSTINVQTTVSVDGVALDVYGTVTYDKWIVPDDVSLSNFTVDETYFMVDYESTVGFTVDAVGDMDYVNLCDSNGEIGTMHDDGINGDVTANDGTYTYVLEVKESEAGAFEYFAKAGNSVSESATIYFFETPAEESKEEFDTVQQKIQEIQNGYVDNTGYVPDDSKKTLMDEISTYLEQLMKDKTIFLYEIEDDTAYIKFATGVTLVFEIPSEGVSAGGTDVSLSYMACQPNPDTAMEDIGKLSDDLAKEFNSESTTYENKEVTLERVKAIGKNQVVLWHGHGGYGPIVKSYLTSGEDFDWTAYSAKSYDTTGYYEDCVQDRIICRSTEKQENLACFTSKFVEKYCGDLSNDLIVLMSCHSGQNEKLANSFIGKGATAVVGFTQTVYTAYCTNIGVYTLAYMTQINANTNNYYTLSQALDRAKAEVGNNDREYARKYPETFKKIKLSKAEPIILGGNSANDYRLTDAKTGRLTGKICRASDRSTPISEATISVIRENKTTSFTPDANGNYAITLPEGEYLVKITAPGYIDFKAYATVTQNENTYMETFLLVEGSEDEVGMATGTINNALTGKGIEGVTLEVRSGWNNSEKGDIVANITTDSSGNYNVTLPLGNYTLYAVKDGYISTMINIIVQEGMTSSQNGTMTPTISSDSFRIVLTWGENPSDLDSHVEGMLSDGNPFHVFYNYKSQYDGDVEVCNLDVDDISSYGPETITLNPTNENPYYYYIHRYYGFGTVASSGAQVKVYQGGNLLATFNVPTDQGNDDYWNVFAIVNGELVVQNTITFDRDISYAGTGTSEQSSNFTEESIPKEKVRDVGQLDNSFVDKTGETE